MMRALVAFSLAIAVPCAAQPVSVAPWMTGARLLELLTYGPDTTDPALKAAQYSDKETARWYIEGVHDSTEGKGWCYSERYRPGPAALHDDIAVGLRSLPPNQLKRNAADLIAEIWRKKWPCLNRKGAS